MKPTWTGKRKNSKLGLKMQTIQPFNNFIVEFLVRAKMRVNKLSLNSPYLYDIAI